MGPIILRRNFFIALCFVGTLTLGLAITFYQMQRTLVHELRENLHHAMNSIDIVLSHGKTAANEANQWIGKTCDSEVLTGLRTLVATIPDVRTVNLVSGDEIYCTSVFGGKNFRINAHEYTNGKLLLLNGNKITPTRSLIVYRNAKDSDNSILVGIDGYYLYNILQLVGKGYGLYIKVGDKVMTEHGIVISLPVLSETLTLSSSAFDYTLIADSGHVSNLWTFLKYEKATITMVVLFALLTTFLFSRYLLYLYTIEYRLKKAIKHKQLTPWIQPIVSAQTGEIIGGEVLLRWNHPCLGFVPPDTFIAIAEQNGMIDLITRNCFLDVVTELERLREKPVTSLIICFNVSANTFDNEEIVLLCHKFNSRINSDFFRPVLEVTERDDIISASQTLKTIHKLKNAHIELSLDDFGTGNANYNYISIFSPNYIKIDKIFTADIDYNKIHVLVVESIIALANKLGCYVVAEGIEREEQANLLKEMGVHFFQGYLFFKPVPVNEFIQLISSKKTNGPIPSEGVMNHQT